MSDPVPMVVATSDQLAGIVADAVAAGIRRAATAENNGDRTVSPSEAAWLVKRRKKAVYDAVASGALESVKVGKRRVVRVADAMAWAAGGEP